MAFYIFKRCAQGTGIRRNCNLLSLENRVSVTIAIASYVYYPSLYYRLAEFKIRYDKVT